MGLPGYRKNLSNTKIIEIKPKGAYKAETFSQLGTDYQTYDKKTRTNLNKDMGRLSHPPGKRISRSGKVYYERRQNRSDLRGQI